MQSWKHILHSHILICKKVYISELQYYDIVHYVMTDLFSLNEMRKERIWLLGTWDSNAHYCKDKTDNVKTKVG